MKVLVADAFETSGLDGLRAAGCEVVHQPDLKDQALADAIAATRADVLVVRGTKVTADMLDVGALSLVVRAGAGYNTIDVAAASARGIYVSNCPGKNAIAVAELALGLILSLDRRIPDNVADLRAGTWNKKAYSKARGLFGRTLGLLGFGHIGQEVARRAHAFGMPVVVWSRHLAASPGPDESAGVPVTVVPTPADAAARADVLSVHLALAPETRGLVGAEVLGRLKPGACFVNTARAEIVDQAALADAVARGVRVALDVYASEPSASTGAFADPVAALAGVYGTHHIGAATEQAQEAIAAETVRVVAAFLRTGSVPNVVNLARKTPATCTLVVRHRDRPGVLAHVFDALRGGLINVQETDNVVFEGARAAIAHINLDADPSDALLASIREGNADIIDLRLVRL